MLTIKEKEKEIEKYIKAKKGVDVKIDAKKPRINGMKMYSGENPFEEIPKAEHEVLVNRAYKYAEEFFNELKKKADGN